MNYRARIKLAATIALTAAVAGASAAPVELRLRNEVQLHRPVVRLGDVAEIVATDVARAEQLADMILMPAPAPGTQRFLSKREVQDLLAAHGEGPGAIRISGRDSVAVTAAAAPRVEPARHHATGRHAHWRSAGAASPLQKVSAQADVLQVQRLRDEIERAIHDYLNARTGQTGGWRIAFDVPERQLQQIETARSASFCRGGNPPWTGQQRFVVSFATAEGEIHVPVYAEVTRPEPVVVATRTVARGATIIAADLEIRHSAETSASADRRTAFASMDELIGLVASRTIQPGEVICANHAQPPLLVKRGELITVSTQGGGIRVRTTVRARQEGVLGDLVQVESLETKERYDARVVGPGEVTVLSIPARGVARGQAGGARTSRR